MENNLVDNLVFTSTESDKVVFNFYSWVKIIEAIIVRYCKKTPQEAEQLLKNSNVYKHALDSYSAVVLTAHETDYHWAMYIVYGEMYWLKGIDSDEPEGYYEWEEQFRLDHNLAKQSFEFEGE